MKTTQETIIAEMRAKGFSLREARHMARESARVMPLAAEFSKVLNEWLTVDQIAEINQRNAKEKNPRICHSHDFCDANQAMIDALERLGARFDSQDEVQGYLVDEAWNVAKADCFRADRTALQHVKIDPKLVLSAIGLIASLAAKQKGVHGEMTLGEGLGEEGFRIYERLVKLVAMEEGR